MNEAFLREAMILGPDALERLSHCHVIVFGIGGVGSYCSEALVRAGIGALTFVDNDTVGVSNLNRQIIALHSTIGRSKADIMAQRALDINPKCRVTSLPHLYNEENKGLFFNGTAYDYIVDAIDLVSCKLSLIKTAKELDIPIISAMGTGNKLDPTQFRIADIAQTTGCPLARIMRKELRAAAFTSHSTLQYGTARKTVGAGIAASRPPEHSRLCLLGPVLRRLDDCRPCDTGAAEKLA